MSAIDDDELRHPQAAVNEVIEERPPGGFALPAQIREKIGDSTPPGK